MGLVQIFRDVPCPDILARHLLDLVLEDLRETGRHYLLHLVFQRRTARRIGTAAEVEALDQRIRRYQLQVRIPEHRGLRFLFSAEGYAVYGDGLLPLWAVVLLQICDLERYWEATLLGARTQRPYLLPGFQSDEAVWSPAWLEDLHRTGDTELRDVYPELGVHLG